MVRGTLVIYASGLFYDAEDKADSRYWRFGDIESVLRIVPLKLLLNVYERDRFDPWRSS